jgi:hypothetical protein
MNLFSKCRLKIAAACVMSCAGSAMVAVGKTLNIGAVGGVD